VWELLLARSLIRQVPVDRDATEDLGWWIETESFYPQVSSEFQTVRVWGWFMMELLQGTFCGSFNHRWIIEQVYLAQAQGPKGSGALWARASA